MLIPWTWQEKNEEEFLLYPFECKSLERTEKLLATVCAGCS